MKRSILILVAIALLTLIAGTVFFNREWITPVAGAPAERPAPAVEELMAAAEQSLEGQAAVVSPVMARAEAIRADQIAAAVNPYRTFDAADVLDETVRAQSGQSFLRRRLVRAGGKYPRQLFKETIRRTDTGYEVVSQVGIVADQIVVTLSADATDADLQALAARTGASVARKLTLPRTYVLQLETAEIVSVDNALQLFAQETAVIDRVQPNHLYFQTVAPNDTEWPLWGMQKIQAPTAWQAQTGDESVLVAVVDSGIDAGHEDLDDNMWVNPGEYGPDGNGGFKQSNNFDDDGNGYDDDWRGWDFYNDDNDPADDNGHGTHCAGVIGAEGNNAQGVAGVCWDISLVGIKILGEGQYDAASDTEIVNAILYAADLGARVQNSSWGGEGSSAVIKESIEAISSNGVLFVAAAGNFNNDNDSNPFYPASYDVDNIISVAATDSGDNLASFSHYGATTVDLAAPGVGIVSTVPDDTYEAMNGTSMAAPHVSGAIALLWSSNPALNYMDVKEALLGSTDKLPSLTGKMVSGGRLNVGAFMTAAADADADGMPDDWEALYSPPLYTNVVDAANDPDSDHLTNIDEYENGTDPADADTDGDSLFDGWEVTYGFSPLSTTGQLDSVERIGIGTDDEAMDVVVVDDMAYVADGNGGLVVINVSDPAHPYRAGVLDTDGFAGGVAVSNGYAYVADGTNGLVVIDVSSPASPVEAGHLDTPGTALQVVLYEGCAYVADDTGGDIGGLDIIDISNPTAPVLTGRVDSHPHVINDVVVSGDVAYLATAASAVNRYDVSNPAAPVFLSGRQVDNAGSVSSIFIQDGVLFVSVEDRIKMLTTSMTFIGDQDGLQTPAAVNGVFASGTYLYAAIGSEGLAAYDISDLENPVLFARYPTYGGGRAVFADGDVVYLADGTSGLQIFGIAFDSDADGMLDSWEEMYFGDTSPGPFADPDGDGINNWGEYLAGLNPTNSDQDADGLIDGDDEVQLYNTDPRTADTDDDGLTDSEEVYATTGYATDPLNPDSDGDGMTDGWEVDNGLDPLTDDSAGDPDGDGVSNGEEFDAGTNPQSPDTDSDGMPDGWEIENSLDPVSDDSMADPDGDGLFNLYEYSLSSNTLWAAVYTSVTGAPASFAFGMPGATDPHQTDSDGDGLSDLFEITTNGTDNLYVTNPNNSDTDNDGLPDDWEIDNSQDPTVPALPTDDSDGDGLINSEEEALGTDRANAADPVFVDDNSTNEYAWGMGIPQISDPNEDGSIQHPFDAIQEGIDAAEAGTTVLVLPGEYIQDGNYELSTGGKALTVRSWNDVTNTVINSQGAGAVFRIDSGESTNTVIHGFTLTTTLNCCSDGDCDQEEAVVIIGSSPVIQQCRIVDCELAAVSCSAGGRPVIRSCEISGAMWGIQSVDSSPQIVSNRIYNIGNGQAGDAGIGIQVFGSTGLLVQDTVVSNCLGRGLVVKNDPDAQVIGSLFAHNRGGMTLDNSASLVEACVVRGNEAPTYYTDENGDWVAAHLADYTLDGFSDTVDVDENGGGLLLLNGASPMIRNCLVVENRTWADDPSPTYNDANELVQAYGLGGGIYIGTECSPTGVNNTVASNHSNTRGGGFTSEGNPYFVNMIFWDNDANDALIDGDVRTNRYAYPNVHCRSGHITMLASDIEFGYSTAAISTTNDPLFVGGGDYHLASTNSAAFSSGIPYLSPTNDLDGNIRPAALPIDMGCYEFVDSDGDGMPDVWEVQHGLDYADPSDAGDDDDSDGSLNLDEYLRGTDPQDPDTDSDGLSDGDEAAEGTDPLAPDSDDDGLSDGDEIAAGTDPLTPDSDGDGMPDGWEDGYGLNPVQYNANEDPDEDGLTNAEEYLAGTNPLSDDTDGDGMGDGWEMENGLNPLVNDAAGDADNDDLSNLEEYNRGTDPQDPDSDNDGITDGQEVADGTDPLDPDLDGDGMPNSWELENGLDPTEDDGGDDEDMDGLTNLEEYQNGTNPWNADTDHDGLPDYWELVYDLNPLVGDEFEDPDDDGLSNLNEYKSGTSPNSADTDSDNMPDLWELENNLNPVLNDASADVDGDGLNNYGEYEAGSDPYNTDTDSDKMPDGWEVDNLLDPAVDDAAGDPDGDLASNLFEYRNGTDPQVYNAEYVDTDSDGMSDAWEILYAPTLNPGLNDAANDPDGDSLSNIDEYLNGTNPTVPDSDGDGLTDGQEVNTFLTQPTNPLDPVFVDDDASGDVAVGGGWDPDISDTNENGSITYPFDSIQEAINYSNTVNGMTVLVTNGLYEGIGNFDINPKGKEITIRSRNGAAGTEIRTHAYGSGFLFNNGENLHTVVQGFTIDTSADLEPLAPEEGVLITAASPVIRDCIIQNCGMEAVSVQRGSPSIIGCTLVDSLYGLYASGSSGVTLQDSEVFGMAARGIFIQNDNLAEVTWTTVSNCAGGITLDGSDASVRQCVIVNNEALNYFEIGGADMAGAMLFPTTNSLAKDVTNPDENGAGVLILSQAAPELINCLIANNRTWAEDPDYAENIGAPGYGLGAGIYVGSACEPVGINCTVVDNHANTRGGGVSSAGRPFFRNMIFWDNTSSNAAIFGSLRITTNNVASNVYVEDEVINIWYSDIEFGYSNAVHSFVADPVFGAGYELTGASPCVNAGTYYLAPIVDLAANERPVHTDYPANRVDVGCYEFDHLGPVSNPMLYSVPLLQADADSDGDGFLDSQELLLGTDSCDAADVFKVASQQSVSGATAAISWQTVPGCFYTVQGTDSLVGGDWVDLDGWIDIAGDGSEMTCDLSFPDSARFFRVVVTFE